MKTILFILLILQNPTNINTLQTNHNLLFNNLVNNTKVMNSNKNENKKHLTNKIIKIWIESDGILNATAEIKDSKEELKISVYNMLGKEVFKVYQGMPLKKDEDGNYKFVSSSPINLFNNVYILVIEGTSYKIADKFIISR
ncbi:MAG: hypothetical protein FWG85_04110 [Bacteroidetes bacterium]|nr:hypothetical protein [Bacteroidota bacterium]